MKQLYICEKCGAQFESFDEAYSCENSHFDLQRAMVWGYPDLIEKVTWKQGAVLPERVYIPVTTWDREAQEDRRHIIVLKVEKELSAADVARIEAAEKARQEAENAEWERRRAEREAQKKAQEEGESA